MKLIKDLKYKEKKLKELKLINQKRQVQLRYISIM